MADNTSQRGGARPGAGRPPTALEPRTVRWGPLHLTKGEARALAERSAERGASAQEAVRAALRNDKLID